MSQNPFAPPPAPSHVSNVLNPFAMTEQRYPDLSGEMMQPQQQYAYTQQTMPAQYQQAQYSNQPAQVQQPTGFQPSSSFGQQLQYQMTGAVAPTYRQQPGTYAAEFDPYGAFGSIPGGQPSFNQQSPVQYNQQQNAQSYNQQSQSYNQQNFNQQPSNPALSTPTSYNAHPRTVVGNNKAALESWDEPAWRTFNSRVRELKEAWEKRKASILRALENQRGRQLQYEEQQRFQTLLKEADERIDVMTASILQIDEVRTGYRHSTDDASRSRVRQALNEALRSMPDWPEDLYTGPTGPSPPPQPQVQQPQYSNQPHNQPYNQQQYTQYQNQPQYFQQTQFQQPYGY